MPFGLLGLLSANVLVTTIALSFGISADMYC
jgi:hypothetical protein